MFAVYRADLKRELLSIRSLVTIALMVALAWGMSHAASAGQALGGSAMSLTGLFAAFVLVAAFAVGLIFSGIFAYDLETQAIRYVVPYMARWMIFIAKYLVIITYFFVTVAIALGIVAASGHGLQLDWKSLTVLLLGYMYFAALVSIVSVVLPRQRASMFVSLLLGVLFPVLGVMGLIWSSNPAWWIVSRLMPYYYMDAPAGNILILAALVLTLTGMGILLFSRKEL